MRMCKIKEGWGLSHVLVCTCAMRRSDCDLAVGELELVKMEDTDGWSGESIAVFTARS